MLDLPVLSPLEVLRSYPPHDYTLDGLLASRARRGRTVCCIRRRPMPRSRREIDGAAAMLLCARVSAMASASRSMARNSHRYLLLFFALARIGAIMVPVNPDFGVREAGYILAHARGSAVACERGRAAGRAAMQSLDMAQRNRG